MSSPPSHLLNAVLPEIRTSFNPGRSAESLGPDVASARVLFLTIVLGLLALLLGALARQWRRQRSERRLERARLDDLLRKRGLAGAEKPLLDAVVRSSGEPLHRVARLVLSFDRGVDRLLLDSAGLPPEDRLLLLRRLKSLRAKLELDRVAPNVPLLSTREISPRQELLLSFGGAASGRIGRGTLVSLDDAGLVVEVTEPPGWIEAVLEAGGNADVSFLRQGDSGYRFRTRVIAELDGAPDDPQALCLLEHPRKLIREQRRDFLRVPLREEVRFAWIPSAALENSPLRSLAEAPQPDRAGVLLDCSGGGFRLALQAPPGIQSEDLILIRLPFLEPPHDGELAVARAVRIYGEGDEIGCAFEDLSQAHGAALVRFVEAAHRRTRCAV